MTDNTAIAANSGTTQIEKLQAACAYIRGSISLAIVSKNITLTDATGEQAAAPSSAAIGPQGGRVKEVGLQFSVTGSYENFRMFLKDLEQSLRIVDVRTMNFGASKEDEYSYSVTLSTYKLNIK